MADRRIMAADEMTSQVKRTYKDAKGALATYRSELIHGLAQQMIYRPPGQEEADPEQRFGPIVDTFEVNLTGFYWAYIDHDQDHRGHEARLGVARQERNEARQEGYESMQPAKVIAETLFGTSYSRLLGFAQETKAGNDAFADQLTTLSNYLATPAGEVHARFPGFTADIDVLSGVITAAKDKFVRCNDKEDIVRRATEASMLKRRDLHVHFGTGSDAIIDAFKGLFRLAGLEEQALRIERSVRRLPRSQAAVGDAGEGEEKPQVEGESAAEEETAVTQAPVTQAAATATPELAGALTPPADVLPFQLVAVPTPSKSA
jgi:hypothetical protein